MEELKKFQSSFFDTIARRRLVEDQDTILELTDRIQELQNEKNCMSDSKEFQDAESVRSGNSHVTSRSVSFPPHPVPEGMLRHSFITPRAAEKDRQAFGTHMYIGKHFCKSRYVIFSTLSSRIESMEFQCRRAASFILSGKEWETNTRSRSEIPVWTVSQIFCHLQWRRLFKELWDRPTTTADFGSSFRQIPFISHVCLLEDEIQNWGMYLLTISCGSYGMDQRSGDGWFSGWLKSSSSTRGIQIPNFEVLDARIASVLNKIIHNSHFKRRISLEEQKIQKQDRFLREKQIAYMIYEYFRITGVNDSVENCADLLTISLRNNDIQEFDSKWDGILLPMTKIPPDDILEWLYDLEIHQKKIGPDYHRLKTMVKRSIEQDLRNRNFGVRNGNYERNVVVKNPETKTACTKNSWSLLTMGSQRTVF